MGLREARNLDQALERAGDGAVVITGAGRIVLWNRTAEKVLGYTAREALGRPYFELFVGRDASGNRLCYKGCHVTTLVRMGKPVENFDVRTRTKAGRPLWLNVSTIVTPNGSGGPLTIHLFRDVTAIKKLLDSIGEPSSAPPSPAPRNGDLTRRELQILRLVAAGETTKDMAQRLHVSPATVRNHVQNIMGKLGVHSRLQAVAYATSHRLLETRGA